jgi:hypothetical protein
MRHHRSSLSSSKLRRFVKDVRYRFVKLSDIVEKRDALHARTRAVIEFGGVAENERIAGDTSDVPACIRIICIDRIQKSLQRRRPKSLGVNARAPLANEYSAGGNSN